MNDALGECTYYFSLSSISLSMDYACHLDTIPTLGPFPHAHFENVALQLSLSPISILSSTLITSQYNIECYTSWTNLVNPKLSSSTGLLVQNLGLVELRLDRKSVVWERVLMSV